MKLNPRPKKFIEAYELPSPTGRYSVWLIAITHQSEGVVVLEFFEALSRQVFADYKISRSNYYDQEENNVIGENLYIVGLTHVRKRLSTLKNDIESISNALDTDTRTNFKIVSLKFFRSLSSFSNTTMKAELVLSKTKASEYKGTDIRILDKREDRFVWQNQMLDFFYDEKNETFLSADDRTIYWITDESGNVGKSKMVKWLCVNRPDEIVKVVFGSAQQLRTSLISVGPRLVYIIDIPRTPSEDEKFENMVSSIEEVKNGHVVSHMSGRWSQLLMDPPHIIILSNQQCPLHLLSRDRWKAYSISNLKLKGFVNKTYKLG